MRGWYDEALLERAAEGPITAKEIARIMDVSESVAVSHLRTRKGFRVTVIERRPQQGRACLYRIEKTEVRYGPNIER